MLVDPQALFSLIEAGTAPAIVDVRSRWEFERGHVPGARCLPFWKIASHVHEIAAQQSDPVVVYCGHGPRAQWAAAVLRWRGFERVILLEGHWARWLREARPQERARPRRPA
jgi:rhodanese-related sulfurtransferase